ncbi:MAG: lipid-A-disaccharide synthase [Puniceicoccales bacterium]|jgi:lipid-A-disaccharide synthase|nr:lipid-A-disaccharide synthase [Puniceicoccales bacterium]
MTEISWNDVIITSPDLLVIAGEHSGDEHGAALIKKLKTANPCCHIYAIGGDNLKKTGIPFLFDLVQFSVVGLVEVLHNLCFFSKFLKMTCQWIEYHRPKVVCFIDFPGFNLRVAKALYERGVSHKAGGNVKLYHYISPQIWAWKAKRRFTIAKYIDALGTIFPFEKECYRDTDLDVQFLGHPFLDEDYILPVKYDSKGPILLLPGSRKAAVKRIFPIMLNTLRRLKNAKEVKECVVIYPDDALLKILKDISKRYKDIPFAFIPKSPSVISASMALMSSGTMALNCALAGIPGIIIYRANILTYILGRMLIKVKFLHIANILLNRESAREFLQFSARPGSIYHAVCDCLHNPKVLAQAQDDARALRQMLSKHIQNDPLSWIQNDLR